MKAFLLLDFNTQKPYKYFIEDLNLDVSKSIISKVYKEMRKIISKYINIEYQTILLGELDLHKYYSVDECNKLTIKGTHIWLLGNIDNKNKDFQIEPTLSWDTATLNAFINRYVPSVNYIVTDGWSEYYFLQVPYSVKKV